MRVVTFEICQSGLQQWLETGKQEGGTRGNKMFHGTLPGLQWPLWLEMRCCFFDKHLPLIHSWELALEATYSLESPFFITSTAFGRMNAGHVVGSEDTMKHKASFQSGHSERETQDRIASNHYCQKIDLREQQSTSECQRSQCYLREIVECPLPFIFPIVSELAKTLNI